MENKKKSIEIKISQMKDNALKEIKNASIKVTMDTVKGLITNSIDKSKLEIFYTKSLDSTKSVLKKTRS